MNEFVEIPANARSIGRRKLIYGYGINDAGYLTKQIVDSKEVRCPYYIRWHSLLQRCYSDKYQSKYPTYVGATVCKEWLTFSVFRSWMERQEWAGLELDKDILSPGNKHYSPSMCCFVTQAVNSLLLNRGMDRGDYPQGVCFFKGAYAARCNYRGKRNFLGYHSTPEEASLVYRKFKANLVAEIAFEQEDERIEHGLMLHAALILKGDLN